MKIITMLNLAGQICLARVMKQPNDARFNIYEVLCQPILQMTQKKTAELLPLLEQTTLFKNLSSPTVKAIYQSARPQTFTKESYIFHQNEAANTIFFVGCGIIHLSQLTNKGKEVVINYLIPGDVMGLAALSADQLFSVTATAVTDGWLLCWSADELASLIHRCPQIALNALQMTNERIAYLQQKYSQLATEQAEQRIARTFLSIAQKSGLPVENGIMLRPPLSRQAIAEMTATTLYTASRICSQWEKADILATNRRWQLIKDSVMLKAIAEGQILYNASS